MIFYFDAERLSCADISNKLHVYKNSLVNKVAGFLQKQLQNYRAIDAPFLVFGMDIFLHFQLGVVLLAKVYLNFHIII